MRWLLFLTLLAGCATATNPTLPPMPPAIQPEVVTAMSKALPLVVVVPDKPWNIVWELREQDNNPVQMPADNVEFDVEHTFSLTPPVQWTLYCRTSQPPVPFWLTNQQEYFRVGDHWIVPPQ